MVFPALGALVCDSGGALSHPAIIAREFGIPAVVGTGNATTAIPDGATCGSTATRERCSLHLLLGRGRVARRGVEPAGVQAGVDASMGQQLVVAPSLDEPSLVEHEHHV